MNQDQILLYYERLLGGSRVTGLSCSVSVVNALTRAVLLSSTVLTEQTAGNGFYQYNWTHNQQSGTACEAQYLINGTLYTENFIINYNAGGDAR
jgi:hypothetical protein